ncbi:MAG: twin-arginine translocase TatA/TatE family subunit [Lentisphaeria bacterium]|nr:twin-arginine translocase TatA/TatE family subunit [Lentisphaeria bacterium]
MGSIGVSELLVLFFIVLLFFGAKRIPEVAKALGKASREFKKARDGVMDEFEREEEPPKKESGTEPQAGSQENEKK